MEFSELIRSRYSVRAYRSDPVEHDKLAQILEAARLAPTAANRQPFKLIVAHTKDRTAELQRLYPRQWFTDAPLVICACAVTKDAWVRSDSRRYTDVDVAIVMDHLILAAANLGLGTCWIAAFNAQAAREVFKLPENVEPLILTPLGYAADAPSPKERKGIAELVTYEHW
jgi:nitroreductase